MMHWYAKTSQQLFHESHDTSGPPIEGMSVMPKLHVITVNLDLYIPADVVSNITSDSESENGALPCIGECNDNKVHN